MNSSPLYTNELINESSPYLLQHAHNPVNWYPWGDKALQKARAENKMLIISIGYAACHWCHVMEHESFEDAEVAKLMNENFICIKVDREERPDVDQVYMTAAQLITGRGGWPLNAMALADGRPFYAGTYFPKDKWMNMLAYFVDLQQKQPEGLEKSAEQVTKGIHATEHVVFKDEEKIFSINDLDKHFETWKGNIDFVRGGENRAPKFPMPSAWQYLLHYNYLRNNEEALKAVTVTLDNMALGGIYDHLQGGFARYSTDANWHVPHFEKMLYDNAQLVTLYAQAYQATKDPLYKKTVYETLDFVKQELTSSDGAFYASLDADSEGVEGKFYVWTKDEVDDALGDDAEVFSAYYNITAGGNWEHGNSILLRNERDEAIAEAFTITVEELNNKIDAAKAKLMQIRNARIKPGLDDKILSSWNALMISGYTKAYRVFGEEAFLETAVTNANFLLQHAIAGDGEMTRNYKNGKASINALLDDYAFTTAAFIELYQATFDEKWLMEADKITGYAFEHFFDTTSGMFFYTHNQYADLIARKMELSDNVIPSSNSEMAKNLFLLGHFFNKVEYISKAKQMLINVEADVQRNIYFYANWGMLQALFTGPLYEVAIMGADYKNKRQQVDEHYLPNVILLGGNTAGKLALLENKIVEGQTMIYVCRDKSCEVPVVEVEKAMGQIGK
ncbi:MAG: thioredoxin domain-containing protein [Chitinophagaceae bacterium]|nr:thioredoxin domain-containing protein [Chitinophagaceae bacterium]